MEIVLDDKFFVKFFERYTSNKGIPASGDIIIVILRAGGSIDSAGRISGDAMKTMNALLKLQEKNLLKYVLCFILLTTLLNHDYAIRHVIFYHEWICSRLPIVLKTQWICFRERTYSNDIHSVLSSHVECVGLITYK